MFARDFRHQAWNDLSGNWGNAIVAVILYGVIVGAASFTFVGSIIVSGPLLMGLSIFFLTLSRTKTTNISNIFEGFSKSFSASCIGGVLVALFTFLWSLLFLIPGIVKSYSYAMTFYILADNPEMSGSDAIAASRKMMDGNKWRMFCLDLSFIGWYLLCGLTCGILTLWVGPYVYAAHTKFYESLKASAQPVA